MSGCSPPSGPSSARALHVGRVVWNLFFPDESIRHASLQDGGRFVALGPRSLHSGRRAPRFGLFESGAVFGKKTGLALSLGAGPAGVGDKEARRRRTHGMA